MYPTTTPAHPTPPSHRSQPSVHRRRRVRVAAALAALGIAGTGALLATGAGAHGYVNGAVKSRAATTANSGRGAIQWEPQSVEGKKGFPAAGPPDGQIASAGNPAWAALDAQSETRWFHWPIATGPLKIDWTYTAPHVTAKWDYFMTKQGWDPNAPLARSEFEKIATVPHNMTAASANPSHTITVPADRSGYHVILAVWEVGDTENSFYNVIDVHVGPGASPSTTASPSDPTTVPGPTTTHVHVTTTVPPVTLPPTTVPPTTLPSPTTTRPAPTTTRPAPTTTRPAPTTTRPAPTTTRPAPTTAAPTTVPPAPSGDRWSPRGTYRAGDVVTWRGHTYRCRQPHRGWGDVNWINARSLWSPIG